MDAVEKHIQLYSYFSYSEVSWSECYKKRSKRASTLALGQGSLRSGLFRNFFLLTDYLASDTTYDHFSNQSILGQYSSLFTEQRENLTI